ncbi:MULTISPECIES: M56 family metallopeptidase [Thermomonosporaceae]|uniref:M56 family metallopeptidase n=1 Tax=Thermomonosporaceae TaxID=2012 RepID=UPI00255ACDC3|nr:MULTISPECIES: M56 family metallopeptidase [Thermomonosporaceae]MDL4770846.1 M56 family metallopeptidase [Actinomadura xylanilytica]
MNWITFLPAAVTLALATALGHAAPPLHPAWSARLLVTVAVTTVLAVAGTVVFVGVNYLAGLAPGFTTWLPEWALFGDDRPLPSAVGLPALTLAAGGAVLVWRLVAGWTADLRSARAATRRPLDTDAPIALAVPGRGGGVVVSRGLLAMLTPEELRVVFQHERSHLRHSHHRYLAAGSLAAAVLPLGRLDERLRFAVERWADEDTAECVGDRGLVARTIARVALTRPPGEFPAYGPFAGVTGSGVVQRVQALLGEPPPKNTVSGPVVVVCAGLVTSVLASTALQIDKALGLTFPFL